jgi:hypothetical protein
MAGHRQKISCVGDRIVELGTHQSGDVQNRRMSVPDACGAHEARHVVQLGWCEATAFGWSVEAWKETLHCQNQKYHHHQVQTNELLVGVSGVGASPSWFSCRSYFM